MVTVSVDGLLSHVVCVYTMINHVSYAIRVNMNLLLMSRTRDFVWVSDGCLRVVLRTWHCEGSVEHERGTINHFIAALRAKSSHVEGAKHSDALVPVLVR